MHAYSNYGLYLRCVMDKLVRLLGGEGDEKEGASEQRQNKEVERDPQCVESSPLSASPLSLTQMEVLLLQVQLRGRRTLDNQLGRTPLLGSITWAVYLADGAKSKK